MTNRRARIWATAASLLALTLIVTSIATHPWPENSATEADPRVLALQRREIHLKHEALEVRRTLKRRWQAYERRLAARQHAIAEAKRRYEAQLAAARQAAAERARVLAIAAQARASDVARTSHAQSAPTASAAAPAPPPAPVVKVVTLPPAVSVVSLPPVTVSTTS